MTNDERRRAFDLRLEGKGWREIGHALGYAGTSVYEDLRMSILMTRKPAPCVYPALAAILARDYGGSISAFASRCGSSYQAMYSVLSGRTTPRKLGGAICAATGLSQQEAFRLREGD